MDLKAALSASEHNVSVEAAFAMPKFRFFKHLSTGALSLNTIMW
jgi:hypothetical protein